MRKKKEGLEPESMRVRVRVETVEDEDKEPKRRRRSAVVSETDAGGDVTKEQVGGSHYRTLPIQPAEFCEANGLSFLEGCVVKRMCRHRRDGGGRRQDLEKAIHEIKLMLILHYPDLDA